MTNQKINESRMYSYLKNQRGSTDESFLFLGSGLVLILLLALLKRHDTDVKQIYHGKIEDKIVEHQLDRRKSNELHIYGKDGQKYEVFFKEGRKSLEKATKY